MDEALRTTISELRRRLEDHINELKSDPKMVEVLKIHKALNTLEDLVGEAKTSLAQGFGLSDEDAQFKIKVDEFYGLSPLEAAKRYLRKRGEARQFDEIITAIQSGGCKVESAEDLRLSLARSTMEIAKVGPDLYGLVEFYSHIKRGRPGRRKRVANGSKSEEPASGQEDGDTTNAENSAGGSEENQE